MLHRWAEKIALFLWKHGHVKEGEQEVCAYGVEILVASLIGIAVTLGIGLWHKDIMAMLWFLIGFIPIRSYAGGYHADRHISCIALFAGAGLLSLFLTSLLMENLFWRLGLSVAAGLIFYCLAPLDHENRRLTDHEKTAFREKSRRIVGLLLLIIWGGSWLGPVSEKLCSGLTSGMVLSGFSLLIAKVIEGRKKHETAEIH